MNIWDEEEAPETEARDEPEIVLDGDDEDEADEEEETLREED